MTNRLGWHGDAGKRYRWFRMRDYNIYMRFLIDGYNLLYHSGLADRSRAWKANRERLLDWLSESFPSSVVWKIVFDAQKMSRLKTVPIESEKVVVAKGESADEWIETFLQKTPSGVWIVISNDRQVRESARLSGHQSWDCDKFLDWLHSPTLPEPIVKKPAEEVKPEAMTDLELKQLERTFTLPDYG